MAAIKEQLPERIVLDGELFVAIGDRLEFEVLQERIHPAKSRVDMLVGEDARPGSSPSTCSHWATSPSSTSRSRSVEQR